MLNELIKQFAQNLIANAMSGIDKNRVLAIINNKLSEIDTYVSSNGASELANLDNSMHGALAFDMLRKRSDNQFIPIYAYILYTQALKDSSVGSADNINEVWMKKAYILIGSEWAAVRSLIVLGCMGTYLVNKYDMNDLMNLMIIGCLLNMETGYLKQNDLKLYRSLQQMRPQYSSLTDSQIRSMLESIDVKILESRRLILR